VTSVVIVPFRDEDPGVLERTLGIAMRHPAVGRVVAVGYDREGVEEAPAVPGVEFIEQRHIGRHRPGKGDGMLTGLEAALADPGSERIHFYDADIRTFTAAWIERAESALDEGFDVARHFFDRAATDAQITWHITRMGLTILWPDSVLPQIEQPLGGELALTRSAAEALHGLPYVTERSDWGIDTALTVGMAASGLSIAEVFVPEGKLHGLYGGLDDLRTMATECFATLQSLRSVNVPPAEPGRHRVDDPGPPPSSVTSKAAFDVEATLPLLTDGWTEEERRLAAGLPGDLADGFSAMQRRPVWSFLDDASWAGFLRWCLDRYDHDDPAWRSLFFRGWVARTLRHTTTAALRGYDEAIRSLRAALGAARP
jgi:mannosylglycerate synthase